MKRMLSLLLALILLLSTGTASLTTQAENASSIAKALASLQTTAGFTPGKTAAVTGNCYGFISAVCEKLYGVAYQEGLASYTCAHKTGYYYTVATITTKKTTDYENLFGIVSFFKNNAQVGDVVHYASLTNSGSKHTFMVQYIDDEKMQIFHSNYGSDNCQIDTIYWKSFLSNPTNNATVNGHQSRNTILYSKMRYGGLGISINRRVGVTAAQDPVLEPEEAVTAVQAPAVKESAPEDMEISLVNPYSVLVEWSEKENAKSYILKYKKKGGSWSAVKAIEGSSYRVRKLTPGKKYYFKVCSVDENAQKSAYTETQAVKLLPPVPSITSAEQAKKGIRINFTPVDYCSGYAVFRSRKKNGTYKKIAVIQDPEAESYTDTGAVKNKTYYYKVWCYVVVGGKVYRSEKSAPVKCKFQ